MVKTVIMPKLGETMEEGEIITWFKQEGDKIDKGEPLLEIATDKANMEIEAATSGYLRKIVAREGEKIPIAQAIAYITDSMEDEVVLDEELLPETKAKTESTLENEEEKEEQKKPLARERKVKASPLAKKIAQEKNIDLSTIQGTGPGGRIVKEDVIKACEKGIESKVELASVEKTEINLSRLEKIIAERMQQSKSEIPHFYLTMEVNVSEAAKLKRDLVEEFEAEKKVRITYTDLLIKACAKALHKFPRTNSYFNQGKIISSSRVNLGLAVARESGLVVPVIKDADQKNIFEIARERQNLVKKSMDNSLSVEDMEGGTFTLSNLGMMQIKNFYAIINPPQVCILATGQIQERVIAVGKEILVAPMMEITLSCDHRVIDGYLGAKFLQEVKKTLEKPALILI